MKYTLLALTSMIASAHLANADSVTCYSPSGQVIYQNPDAEHVMGGAIAGGTYAAGNTPVYVWTKKGNEEDKDKSVSAKIINASCVILKK